jgi:uncharacterized OsmC-like protein
MNEPHVPESMVERQDRLRERYREAPGEARITDRGRTTAGDLSDPVHVWVVPGSQPYGVQWRLGIHEAVAGLHDAPNPGDLLCTALAACMDSVIRMAAERHGVVLEGLDVDVTGDIDVRGTLWVSREARVGMQRMRCQIRLRPAAGTDRARLERLLAVAERSCVNLDTLRNGVPVEIDSEIL